MEKKMSKLIKLRNQLFSPKKSKSHPEKAFSSQIITVETQKITAEAEAEEPISPKISCMGNIKHKNKQRKKKLAEVKKTKESSLRDFLVKPQEKRSGVPRPHPKVHEKAPRAPNPIHKWKSASAHNSLAEFDWWAQVMVHAPSSEADNERENKIISFSAPIIMGGLGGCEKISMELKPKKEINLWKRRTMAQPTPLYVAPLR